jgi:hypothetical protein
LTSRNLSDRFNERRSLTSKGALPPGTASSVIAHPAPDSGLPRLNEKQLAERWQVSVRTLQAARVKGSGVPFVRIGRAVRYRMEDVLAYEEAQRRTSTSEP